MLLKVRVKRKTKHGRPWQGAYPRIPIYGIRIDTIIAKSLLEQVLSLKANHGIGKMEFVTQFFFYPVGKHKVS